MNEHEVLLNSPVGPVRLTSDGDHLTGLFFEDHQSPSVELDGEVPAGTAPVLQAAIQQLREYFAGQRRHFDLPVTAAGTPFQERVWAALREIPYGQTWSYKQLAEAVGNPNAYRAVGLANGRNPVSIVVPCHRVIGADGKIVGYGGGVHRKQALLDLERHTLNRN